MATSLQNYKLISIAGLANSGKSESSAMLAYLLNSPKLFRTFWWYKFLKKWPFKRRWKITAFAKPLKQSLAILLNKPENWFENRENKEFYYVSLSSLKLYHKDRLHDNIKLSENKFQKLIKTGDPLPNEYLMSVRQLMQYFGTEVVRKYLGDKTWINSTLNGCKDNTIISDLRFKVELDEIQKRKGICIYIKRDLAKPGSHASEREVIDLFTDNRFDFVVDNNGSLNDLFNNLKKLI